MVNDVLLNAWPVVAFSGVRRPGAVPYEAQRPCHAFASRGCRRARGKSHVARRARRDLGSEHRRNAAGNV